jgi:hypothetical protein
MADYSSLLLRFSQHFFKEGFIHQPAFSDILVVFDEINRILAGDLFGIKGSESKEGFSHHIGRQPVPVVIL